MKTASEMPKLCPRCGYDDFHANDFCLACGFNKRETKLKAQLGKAIKQRDGYIFTLSACEELNDLEHIKICNEEIEEAGK